MLLDSNASDLDKEERPEVLISISFDQNTLKQSRFDFNFDFVVLM